jgi:hypothetical protein
MSYIIDYSKNDYKKIIEYLKNYDFTKNLADPKFNQQVRLIHKSIYNFQLVYSIFKEPNEYLKEALSDAISIIPLTIFGYSKATRLLHRSFIENSMRFLCFQYSDHPEVVSSTRVSEIFDEAKNSFKEHSIVTKHINFLFSDYSYLCQYSHTSDFNNLSLETCLKDLHTIDVDEFENIQKYITNSILSINTILLYIYLYVDGHPLTSISPFKKDDILDSVSEDLIEFVTFRGKVGTIEQLK